jgi:hypothetical protein
VAGSAVVRPHCSVIMLLKQPSAQLAPRVIGRAFDCCICSAPSFVALQEAAGRRAALRATQESFSPVELQHPSHSLLAIDCARPSANSDTSTTQQKLHDRSVPRGNHAWQLPLPSFCFAWPQPRYSASSLAIRSDNCTSAPPSPPASLGYAASHSSSRR